MTGPLSNLPRKAIAGFVCIYLAGLGWLAEFFIPFSQLPNKTIIFTAVLIAAELLFIIGVALLGKTYYRQLKTRLLDYIRRSKR